RRLFIAGSIGTAATLAACSATTSQGASSGGASSVSSAQALEPTKDWFIPSSKRPPENVLGAYAGQGSVLPGETIDLHVSTVEPNYRTEVFRVGDYNGLGGGRLGSQG